MTGPRSIPRINERMEVTGPMPTRTTTRVEVLCSMCGPDCWANGKGEWPTVAAAYAELATEGWLIEESRQLCPWCARTDDCDRVGHDFGAWIAARASCTEWRWCHHCTEIEVQAIAPGDAPAAMQLQGEQTK